MGKITISMAIFNSYVSHYQRVVQVPEAPKAKQKRDLKPMAGSLLANSQLLKKKQQRCPDVPIKLAGSCMDAYTPQRVANHPKFQGQIGVAGLCFLGAQTVQVEDNGWDANDTSCGGWSFPFGVKARKMGWKPSYWNNPCNACLIGKS